MALVIRLAVTIVLLVLAAPHAGDAQPPRTVVIGVLSGGTQAGYSGRFEAFRQALRESGHVDTRHVRFEERWADGRLERLPELAAELVRLKVDVIVAPGTPAALAAKRATREIPIVFPSAGDPVGNKLVESLARPGGNVTGLSIMTELGPKRLELMRQALPNVNRIALLTNHSNPGNPPQTKLMQDAAHALKVDFRVFDVHRPDDLDAAFIEMAKQRVGALIITAEGTWLGQQTRLSSLALKYRLPTMVSSDWVQAGFLMTFAIDIKAQYRRAAMYVARILQGARPADLPVEQPTKFRFVVNLRTAKALGVTIPPAVLLQADEVIQ